MRKTISLFLVSLQLLSACSSETRNGFMLHPDLGQAYGIAHNPLYENGYDWWWHSFVGVKRSTGELQPFFIEYYVINPGLGGPEPILGQELRNRSAGIKPSYAMMKVGSWVEGDSRQIHNFYGIDQFSAAKDSMDVRIGNNIATETALRGSVALTEEEVAQHPEYMSQAGSMSWDLKADKFLSYSVGYAASELFTLLNSFAMWWHIPGMRVRYEGTVTYNGEIFDVYPDRSYGYQDKNWGTEYTNPWVWLNCNKFKSQKTGQELGYTSLDVGGGLPQVFNIPLGKRVLVVFYHEGELYEFNFSKLWKYSRQKFDVKVGEKDVSWDIEAESKDARIEINFSNPKSKMLKVNYESPRGAWEHRELWNGGHASGTVKLYKRHLGGWRLIDTFIGEMGGSEYGEHSAR